MESRENPQVRPGVPGTIGAFNVLGVPVRLHFTFVLLLTFLIVAGLSSRQSDLVYALYVASLFASVIMHELGHAWAASRYGIRTLEIIMFPIGGLARLNRNTAPREELWISLAGPAVNVLIAGGLFGYAASQHQLVSIADLFDPTDANLAERVAFGNLILAGLNLLPAFPMDGGRALRAILALFKPEDEATQIAATSGRMLAIAMGLYGLVWMHFMLVFVAFFVYLGAAQESAALTGRQLTHGIPVRAAMLSEFHTLSHGNTIRDAANLLLASSQQDFPVVHGGRVVGLLGRMALLRAMAIDGGDTYVAAAMDRNFLSIPPNKDLAEVLPMMTQPGACALVMEEDRLLGILTTENLSQFLLLRRFGLEPAPARG